MKLSIQELLNKFPYLNKFKDQKWISEEAVKADCNYKELPLKASFEMIKELIEFIEKTKFSNRWEEGFSIKVRLKQIQGLLLYFCEDTREEKAVKGLYEMNGIEFIPPYPIHFEPEQKKAKKVKRQVRPK